MDIDLDKVLGTTTNTPAQQGDDQSSVTAVTDDTQQNSQNNLGQMVQGNLPQQQTAQVPVQQVDDQAQQTGQGISVSPEGGPVVETVNPMEKQFEELNEVLDTNLTDEIERDLFEEAVGQGPVPEGHEVMKQTIESEQEADKAASGDLAPVVPSQPGVPQVPTPDAQIPPQAPQVVPTAPQTS